MSQLEVSTPAVCRTVEELRDSILEQTARVRNLKVKPEIEEATRELEEFKEEFKTVAGRAWSDLRAEGPILLTTNSVDGREVLPEFREKLKQLRRDEVIATNATILIITGSHGYANGELGPQNSETYWFYNEDCKQVGIKPGPYHEYDSDWKTKVPIITKEAEKLDPLPPECFYGDDILRTMDIRVANMGYYYGDSFNKLDGQKLLEDIEAVNPEVIVLGFCYSLNNKLAMLLRSNGTFSSMILNHDLKVITGNLLAEMNYVQKDLLAEIVESSLETCLFVWGSAGTGKTLILMEALKIKLSKLLSQGRRVRILATGFHDVFTTELLSEYEKH